MQHVLPARSRDVLNGLEKDNSIHCHAFDRPMAVGVPNDDTCQKWLAVSVSHLFQYGCCIGWCI